VVKGSGDAGNLFISTPELRLTGGGLGSETHDKGKGGDIRLEVGRLTIDFGSIVAITAGAGNAGNIEIGVGTLTLSNGSLIVAGTAGDGNAGNIEIGVGTLTLSNGSRIIVGAGGSPFDTGGPGRAGNITVHATDSISIAGRAVLPNEGLTGSGLTAFAARGSGDGGQIFVSAPVLNIGDGGEISSAALPASTGNAGDIRLDIGRLTISGDADIATITLGPGQGGDIQVQAGQIELTNSKAAITASSFGTGNAGNITIHADDTFRSRNSVVTTESIQSGGGKIDLSAGQIVELVDSQVTTTVQGGAGDAGNITLGPRYVILNDSQVIAQAVEGNGGNIFIDADVFLASPTSVVDASSQTGISGTIDIRGAVSNLSGLITPLPQGYLSIAALSEDRCAGRLREGQISSFVVTGREGMPLQPGGLLPSPLYEAGQVRAQGVDFGAPRLRSGRTGVKGWQVPRVTPIALEGGCGR
jgi:large exoprotein involved in heme utilization and adhesion